jgi:hypothetical protein
MIKHLIQERINRRQALKVAGGLMLAAIFDVRATSDSYASATRMRWIERDLFPQSGTYQSAVFPAEQSFNSVEVGWIADIPDGSGLHFEVRTSVDGDTWSEWFHLHTDSHSAMGEEGRVYAAPHLVGSSNYVQYRVELQQSSEGDSPVLHEVEIGCVDTSAPAGLMSTNQSLIDGWIISRAGWGANENYRFNGGSERWTPRYADVQKVIVHHTATQEGRADPAAVVRAVYYYHAITLGWGDIGYNYLVDWHGNVYEGRFGGKNVIGAHTYGYNTGSLGVAVIGNFVSAPISQAALDGIVRVIQRQTPNVDPAGAGPFHDRVLVPNIAGHKDYLSTECPGNQVQSRLPEIRGWAAGTGPIDEFRRPGPTTGEILSCIMQPAEIYAGSTMRIDITVRNSGPNTMYTQGPPSGYTYRESETFLDAERNRYEGMYRVGVNFDGNSSYPNLWRWGLPRPLEPGETGTATGFVRLDSVRDWRMTASLVCELVRYDQNGVFPHSIRTLPPPTRPASHDPQMHYFEVTQHNVPDIFYRYWERHGGLFRFGYPLTEAIMEVSETDGETYLTQYFERARFEHHPENAGTQYEVLLGLLGSERTAHRLYEAPFRPIEAPPDSNDVDYFPETKHTLRAGFRDYWWNNGGLSIFGFPISEEFQEQSQTDGQVYTVQYFERNRFEWHPELTGTPYEVLLGHLAREILIERGWLEQDF